RRILSKSLARGLAYNSKAIATYADGHIVSAKQCADFLRDRMNVPPQRIAVIPQAAPQAFIEGPAPRLTSARVKRILYAGQFAFFKAPTIVASVMNELAQRCDQLEFTWVCSRRHHGAVLNLLSSTLRRRIRLLDWMPQQELMKLYDDHGIFLFPSFFEGFGKV